MLCVQSVQAEVLWDRAIITYTEMGGEGVLKMRQFQSKGAAMYKCRRGRWLEKAFTWIGRKQRAIPGKKDQTSINWIRIVLSRKSHTQPNYIKTRIPR